ncbi:hypothetical protein RUM44_001086 [Polyplax serrata]|uniref:Uncharacterized protein n=1 Tax=Polyplax serrata TaxID=468196 RepID=A0ABR1B9V2_POLSC
MNTSYSQTCPPWYATKTYEQIYGRKPREKASHRFLILRPEDLFYRREPNRKEEEDENDDDDDDDDVED